MNIFHSILPPQYTERKIHPETKKNLDKWITMNPNLNLNQKIFTYNDCRNFLIEFEKKLNLNILEWFDREPDGRYKSDIWRLCILYEYGGIYVDIDQEPLKSISDYLDLNRFDFCAASNMGFHNVSNGFIYTKKNSKIIKNNIYRIIEKYEQGGPPGGCHVMGEIITKLTNGKPFKMPLGEKMIGNENCLFLHEIGDTNLRDGTQSFYDSFGFYAENDTIRVMNARYKGYSNHKFQKNNFIEI